MSFAVLGYIAFGVVIFACFFLAVMCHHWSAVRKKKLEEEAAANNRTTNISNGHNQFNTNSGENPSGPTASRPIWTTQISVDSVQSYVHNTLPRIEERYPRREIRRQSDVDILFGHATIFGFVNNERIEIRDNDSHHSGSDTSHKDGTISKDGLPTYHEATKLSQINKDKEEN
uniref:CSON014271 protein n=1 Tax=Culicoides sonorensis TaxID=179676 RepID=A0A336ME52_CULSO